MTALLYIIFLILILYGYVFILYGYVFSDNDDEPDGFA